MVKRVPKRKVMMYLPDVLVDYIDKRVELGDFENRSHGVAVSIRRMREAEA